MVDYDYAKHDTTRTDMLYCYMPIQRNGETKHELCIVPDKPDPLSSPIVVDNLQPTNAAVFRVGAEEAMVVTYDEREQALFISALEPALVYLTPNLAAFPGMRARHLKIQKFGNGQYRTYYSKDKARWDEWTPSKERV